MKNSLKRNFINLGLFVLVFAFILVIATLYDLEISKLLTKNVLLPGEYYSISIIGRLIEYIGSAPIFLIGSFACLIFIHNIYSLKDKRKYLSLIFVVILIVLLEKFFGDTLKYYARHHEIEYILDYFYVDLILWGFALISSAVLLFFYRKVEVDKNKKLLNFAYVILFTCIFYLLIELIKTPVGRMRYRAMNELGDFSYFTPWYQISDAKTLLKDTYTLKDAFKSFPSGHTFSAGISYVLICIPYVFEKFNTKKWKVIFYLIPICYTGLVATFRIVVGAHYLSDVLFGGTIAYVASEVFKYVFILRKKNL